MTLLKRKPASYPLGLSLFFNLTGQCLKTIDNVELPRNIYMVGVGTHPVSVGKSTRCRTQGITELIGNCLSGAPHSVRLTFSLAIVFIRPLEF